MKKVIITLIITAILAIPSAMFGQSTIDNLYKKYAGKKGFTSINISPELFSMIASLDTEDSTENAKSDQDVMKELSGLKMLVYEPEGETDLAFLKEVKAIIPSKGFTELMSVDSEGETVKFLIKKGDNDKISEMLMIVLDEKEAVIMSMTGNLDMSTISAISKSLEIDGMEKLVEIEEK